MASQLEIITNTTRACCTSGVALLGAAAIAVSPVLPVAGVSPPQQHAIESLAVELASTIDPTTPWVNTFTSAAANITTLLEFYAQKPLPLLQTLGANTQTYLGELLSGKGNLIPGQITNNIQTFFQAPNSPGETAPVPGPPGSQTQLATGEYLSGTSTGVTSPNLTYQLLFSEIVAQAGSAACQDQGDCLVVNAAPVLNLINNHASALGIAFFGTILGPVFQLSKSATAIGDFLQAGDIVAAINEVINIPANVTNAFLNGFGYVDRTEAVNMLIPGGLPVGSIGVELGGLLSSVPYNGSLTDPGNPPTQWTGGVSFDGVTTTTGSTTLTGLKLGFLGSVIGMGQFLSDKLLVTPPQAGRPVASATATAPATAAASSRGNAHLSRASAEGSGRSSGARAAASTRDRFTHSAAARQPHRPLSASPSSA